MRRLCIIMAFVINAFIAFSQVATYKSENGNVVNMSSTPSCTFFQINGNDPFSMVVTGINNGWYVYFSPAGSIWVSVDLQNLSVVSGNPPTTEMFKLTNISGTPGGGGGAVPSAPTQYQSGRSQAQIQYDITKTQGRISDNERILGDLQRNNQSVTLWPSYQRMIREDRDRLYQLQQELANASY